VARKEPRKRGETLRQKTFPAPALRLNSVRHERPTFCWTDTRPVLGDIPHALAPRPAGITTNGNRYAS
jgi:hypothetical protein